MKRKILFFLSVLILLTTIFSVSASAEIAVTENNDVSKKELIMATNANFPPYEFVQDNKYAGIDIEIAEEIAKALGMTLKIEDIEFGSIIGGVQTGKFDIGMAGITVDEDRLKNVNFTEPYAVGIQSIIVKIGSEYNSIDDFFVLDENGNRLSVKKGVKIGVQQDTTGDIYSSFSLEEGGFGEENVLRYKSGADAVQSLVSGKCEAVIIDNEPAKSFVSFNKKLKIIDTPFAEEAYAICVNKKDVELLSQINNVLAQLKENGTINKIISKYINSGDDESTDSSEEQSIAKDEEQQSVVDDEEQQSVVEDEEQQSVVKDKEDISDEEKSWFEDFKEKFILNFVKEDRWELILNGLLATLEITFFALIIGIVIGVFIAAVRSTYDKNKESMKKRGGIGYIILSILNAICKLYLTVIRGTPVVVQLLIMYFIVFASSNNSEMIAIISFGINSGAYVAEIIRGGIMSVDNGQFEAGRSLGFNYPRTMIHVILPQAFKTVLPSLCNEFIVLVKETSIAGYVGITDLTKAGDLIRGRTFSAFMPLIAVALIYLVIVIILTKLVGILERRLRKNER